MSRDAGGEDTWSLAAVLPAGQLPTAPAHPRGRPGGHGKELGASQHGDKGQTQIRKVIAWLCRERLVSSQNFCSRL